MSMYVLHLDLPLLTSMWSWQSYQETGWCQLLRKLDGDSWGLTSCQRLGDLPKARQLCFWLIFQRGVRHRRLVQ